jgi:hypothetical protein
MIGSGNNTILESNNAIISDFYNFSGGNYSISSSIDEAYKGYFVRLSSEASLNIQTSNDENEIIINLTAGWNMIATIYDSSIIDSDGIIISDLYNFSNGNYSITKNNGIINAFKGYFVRAKQSGIIKIVKNK